MLGFDIAYDIVYRVFLYSLLGCMHGNVNLEPHVLNNANLCSFIRERGGREMKGYQRGEERVVGRERRS